MLKDWFNVKTVVAFFVGAGTGARVTYWAHGKTRTERDAAKAELAKIKGPQAAGGNPS